MNKYDTEHVCSRHAKMSEEEWMRTYRDAWKSFYNSDHIETLFRRRRAEGHSVGRLLGQMVWFCGSMFVEGVHPLQAGVIRRKHRAERRPTFLREGFFTFTWRRVQEVTSSAVGMLALTLRLYRISRRVEKDLSNRTYQDLAIKAVVTRRNAPFYVLPASSLRVLDTDAPAHPVHSK